MNNLNEVKKIIVFIVILSCSLSTFCQTRLDGAVGQNKIETDKKIGNRFVSAGFGIGMEYGNFGGKIAAKLGKGIGVSVGLGSHFVPFSWTPLNSIVDSDFSTLDNGATLEDINYPFGKSTKQISGFSYSFGLTIFPGPMEQKYVAMSLKFVKLGSYNSLYDNNKIGVYGGYYGLDCYVPFGKLPIMLNLGLEVGFALSGKDYFIVANEGSRAVAMPMGVHLGIHYVFRY